MRQRDNAIVRIGGIVEEHRQVADIGQQHTRGDDDEIGFAESEIAIIVECAQ